MNYCAAWKYFSFFAVWARKFKLLCIINTFLIFRSLGAKIQIIAQYQHIYHFSQFGRKKSNNCALDRLSERSSTVFSLVRYWKRVEAGLVDKELYASWLGSVNFDAISKLICGPSSRVIYALFALHTAGLQLEIFFFLSQSDVL